MLHEVTVLAYELGWLWRDDLDRERLQALLPGQAQDRFVLFLLLSGPLLLLDDELLDGLYVAAFTLGRRPGGRPLGAWAILGFVLGTLVRFFVVDAVFDVFHSDPRFAVGGFYSRGQRLPGRHGRAFFRTGEHPAQPRCSQGEGSRRGIPERSRKTKQEDEEGPKRPLVPRRRGAALSTQPLGSLFASPSGRRAGHRRSAPSSLSPDRRDKRATKPRGRTRFGPLLRSEYLPAERHREDGTQLLDRGNLHRIRVVRGE